MITLDKWCVIIEDLDQILLLDDQRVRCLLKDFVVDLSGSHFHVSSLSEKELVLKGRVKAVELNER